MALYARMTGTEDPSLSGHILSAAFGLWANGKITRPQVVAALELNAAAQVDVDAMVAKYNSYPATTAGSLSKLNYLRNIEHANIGAIHGKLTESQWRTILEI